MSSRNMRRKKYEIVLCLWLPPEGFLSTFENINKWDILLQYLMFHLGVTKVILFVGNLQKHLLFLHSWCHVLKTVTIFFFIEWRWGRFHSFLTLQSDVCFFQMNQGGGLQRRHYFFFTFAWEILLSLFSEPLQTNLQDPSKNSYGLILWKIVSNILKIQQLRILWETKIPAICMDFLLFPPPIQFSSHLHLCQKHKIFSYLIFHF